MVGALQQRQADVSVILAVIEERSHAVDYPTAILMVR